MKCFYCLATTLALVVLSGCGPTRNALPAELNGKAEVVAMPGVRAWGDEFSPLLQKSLVESIHQAFEKDPNGWVDGEGYVNILLLSGGGSDGAFGAGLLNGWSASGKRPTFKLVTGISAGALIAPFAFIGPEYDQKLKKLCTEFDSKRIYAIRPLTSVLAGSHSLADTTPLAQLLVEMVDQKFLDAVATAHRQGRRLLIGTTNLDARRPVIWDMGAIAASGRPEALHLFREVMRASAAIPAVFQPIYIPVEAGGARYDEMHVDGGITAQVFFYGSTLDLGAAMKQAGLEHMPKARVYVICNAQFRVQYEQVEPRLLPIALRSLLGLTAAHGEGDLYRIYFFAQRDSIDFNLKAIPADHVRLSKEEFNPEEMRSLFEAGFQEASSGIKWEKSPPGSTARSDQPVRS